MQVPSISQSDYSLLFQPYHPHITPNKPSKFIKLAIINVDVTKHFFQKTMLASQASLCVSKLNNNEKDTSSITKGKQLTIKKTVGNSTTRGNGTLVKFGKWFTVTRHFFFIQLSIELKIISWPHIASMVLHRAKHLHKSYTSELWGSQRHSDSTFKYPLSNQRLPCGMKFLQEYNFADWQLLFCVFPWKKFSQIWISDFNVGSKFSWIIGKFLSSIF